MPLPRRLLAGEVQYPVGAVPPPLALLHLQPIIGYAQLHQVILVGHVATDVLVV
jgi:hypothetical protein